MNYDFKQTQRFSHKAEYYAKYRPKYPKETITILKKNNVLINSKIIADIGSGTGILSKLFLDAGYSVYGVEPNNDMRRYAEGFLKYFKKYKSMKGTAESTNLPSHSIDLITVGQAFHWFDPDKAKSEFKRILKPKGYVMLIWNSRSLSGTLYSEYLKKYSKDYDKIKSMEVDYDAFFTNYKHIELQNPHLLDFEELKGLTLSSSYFPMSFTDEMLEELKEIFNKTNKNGKVIIDYTTNIYYGVIK